MAEETKLSVADGYLALLSANGVDYFFGNAGTDFAPIVEAFSQAAALGRKVPKPVIVPHEAVAVAMAHGYYQITGRAQAVMVHVQVGTANGICNVINAADQKVPILFTAGRSPVHESGPHGARNRVIHWAQEMYDQAGMLRMHVKWDYELRTAAQLRTVVDRAFQVAMSEPRGPVYLSLPREVIASPLDGELDRAESRMRPAPAPVPHPDEIARAAAMIAKAKNPLIVTADVGRDAASVAALEAFAERFAIPVVNHHPRFHNIGFDHPMYFGSMPGKLLAEADLVFAIECDVPWLPGMEHPQDGAKVIQLGLEPMFLREPIRGFPADAVLTGASEHALPLLTAALAKEAVATDAIDARRGRLAERRAAFLKDFDAKVDNVKSRRPIDPAWASRCIAEACGPDAIYVGESAFDPDQAKLNRTGSSFRLASAGGLGWGLGAALGIKLASPDKLVVASLGDGAYIFNNPLAAHYVSQAENLPLLVIVFNNGGWESVRRANRSMYPEGLAVQSNRQPLSDFTVDTAFEQVVQANGGYGARVDDPAALPEALAKALHAVQVEGRQALLNIITAG
ncbi:MAG: thiamine pyrophosphate-requiring protein [Pseudolabrys sp.]|nr:thiamine pyrophosphate-requiring protein [Pseudolabrys sp.]